MFGAPPYFEVPPVSMEKAGRVFRSASLISTYTEYRISDCN